MKWIYRYLRADGEEIDMGPYESKKEAFEAYENHCAYGALCLVPILVDDGYKLYKGEYE